MHQDLSEQVVISLLVFFVGCTCAHVCYSSVQHSFIQQAWFLGSNRNIGRDVKLDLCAEPVGLIEQ